MELRRYFVGAKNVEDGIEEDGGFAINGGRGWSDVVFDNHQIDLNGNTATAMGMHRSGECFLTSHSRRYPCFSSGTRFIVCPYGDVVIETDLATKV